MSTAKYGLVTGDSVVCAVVYLYLNSLSSSITCMPWSYCSSVGASPTFAKWLFPLTVMIIGAVGNFDAATEGRLSGRDMVERRALLRCQS